MNGNERYEVMYSTTCVKDGAVVPRTGQNEWKRVAEYRTKDEAVECVEKLIDANVENSIRNGGTVLGTSDEHFAEVASSGTVFYKRYRIELIKEVRELVDIK